MKPSPTPIQYTSAHFAPKPYVGIRRQIIKTEPKINADRRREWHVTLECGHVMILSGNDVARRQRQHGLCTLCDHELYVKRMATELRKAGIEDITCMHRAYILARYRDGISIPEITVELECLRTTIKQVLSEVLKDDYIISVRRAALRNRRAGLALQLSVRK